MKGSGHEDTRTNSNDRMNAAEHVPLDTSKGLNLNDALRCNRHGMKVTPDDDISAMFAARVGAGWGEIAASALLPKRIVAPCVRSTG